MAGNIIRIMTSGGIAAMLLSQASLAHHSESAYDKDRQVTLQGVVTEYRWRNPHVFINVEVMTGEGESEIWEFETGSTPILVRSGWTPGSLQAGDKVTLRGHPKRNGNNAGILLDLEKSDGSMMQQVDVIEQPRRVASGLNGTWQGRGDNARAFRKLVQDAALTDKGQQGVDEFDYFRDSSAATCIPRSTPMSIIQISYLSDITINEDTVVIRNERFDSSRTVYMDGRDHPTEGERLVHGHSIGSWEGDVLVVDTAWFTEDRSPYDNGVPSGTQKHVVERYSLAEDDTALRIDIRLEDPEYLAEPVEGNILWNYVPALKLEPYNCDVTEAGRYRDS